MRLDYSTQVTSLSGEPGDLSPYQGQVLLIVNTASKCGLTPQYEGLEKLHQDLGEAGLKVLGFPCNQFGAQEPGGSEEIQEFCQINYGVSFPMHARIEVNGPGTHPLFERLKTAAPGLLGSKSIKWNFTKFLVDRQGNIVARFGPKTEPHEIAEDIRKLL